MPPTMHYFMKINEILRGMTKETLSDKSILIGNADAVIETLKRVESDRHRRGHPLLQRGP